MLSQVHSDQPSSSSKRRFTIRFRVGAVGSRIPVIPARSWSLPRPYAEITPSLSPGEEEEEVLDDAPVQTPIMPEGVWFGQPSYARTNISRTALIDRNGVGSASDYGQSLVVRSWEHGEEGPTRSTDELIDAPASATASQSVISLALSSIASFTIIKTKRESVGTTPVIIAAPSHFTPDVSPVHGRVCRLLTAYRERVGPVLIYDRAKARKMEKVTVEMEMRETTYRQYREARADRARRRRLARLVNKPLPKLPSSANLNKPLPPLPTPRPNHATGRSTSSMDGPFVDVDLNE